MIIRPSGTEPKLKCYLQMSCPWKVGAPGAPHTTRRSPRSVRRWRTYSASGPSAVSDPTDRTRPVEVAPWFARRMAS